MSRSRKLHQPPLPRLSAAFEFKKGDLKAWLYNVIEGTPETDPRKEDLKVLWEEFLKPRFDHAVQLRMKPRPVKSSVKQKPGQELLDLDPIMIHLHGEEIWIRSAHCALSAVLTLMFGRLPIVDSGDTKCVVIGAMIMSLVKFARCMVTLLWKWSHVLADKDPYELDPEAATPVDVTMNTTLGSEIGESGTDTGTENDSASGSASSRRGGDSLLRRKQKAIKGKFGAPNTFCVMWAETDQLKDFDEKLQKTPECILIYGTTKAGEARYRRGWQMNDAEAMIAGVGPIWLEDSGRSASTNLYRAPANDEFSRIESLLQRDSKDNKVKEYIFREYRKRLEDQDKVEKARKTSIIRKVIPRSNEDVAYWQYGDCAETWGIILMARILRRSSFASTLAVGNDYVRHIMKITDEGNTLPDPPPLELKPACRNCTYMLSAMKWNKKITIADQDMLEQYPAWMSVQDPFEEQFEISMDTSFLDDSFSKDRLVQSLETMLVQKPFLQVPLEDRTDHFDFHTRAEAVTEFRSVWKGFQRHLSMERNGFKTQDAKDFPKGFSYILKIGINFERNRVWLERHENKDADLEKHGSMSTTITLETPELHIYVVNISHFWKDPVVATRVPKRVFYKIAQMVVERADKN